MVRASQKEGGGADGRMSFIERPSRLLKIRYFKGTQGFLGLMKPAFLEQEGF
jgi:hypothetical protein